MKHPFTLAVFGILFCLPLWGQGNYDELLKKPVPGLPQVSPEEAGLNPDTIQKMLQLLRETPPPDFRGVVVIKDNQLVLEEYFNTFWRATIHDIRSAGKSVTALLLGIAIHKGLIKDVDQLVYDFFPEYKKLLSPTDPRLKIRIKDLLMMSSGLAADTDDLETPGHGLFLVTSDNWVEFALDLPMAFEPGSKWVYNDVCAMLTGAIVQQASGMKLADFAETHLFTPLGIKEYYWYTGPNNTTGAMGNLYITALDFAKIGVVVENEGVWQGQRLVSAEWIKEMTSKQLDISDNTPFATHYGYFWYLNEVEVEGRKYTYTYASGNGGNKLYVVPQENLVISIMSSAYGRGYGHGRARNILRYILSSIE